MPWYLKHSAGVLTLELLKAIPYGLFGSLEREESSREESRGE